MGFFKRSSAGEGSAASGHAANAERRRRYQPSAAYALAESLRQRGIDFAKRAGPWQVAARALRRPGRNGLAVLPIVTNGMAQIMVDTMEHAVDLAGLLNWCGVDELDPVSDLVPPPTFAADGPAFA